MEDHILAAEAQRSWQKLGRIKKLLLRRFGWRHYLGHPQKEGFFAAMPYYLFWCRNCQKPAEDYPRGFLESRHFICPSCGEPQDF